MSDEFDDLIGDLPPAKRRKVRNTRRVVEAGRAVGPGGYRPKKEQLLHEAFLRAQRLGRKMGMTAAQYVAHVNAQKQGAGGVAGGEAEVGGGRDSRPASHTHPHSPHNHQNSPHISAKNKIQANDPLSQIATLISSREWRLDNLYMILTEDGGIQPMSLRDEQKQFMRERHNRNFVPKARKLGMSTFIVLDYLDSCLFPPRDESTKVISPDGRTATFKTKVLEVGHIDLKEADAWAKLGIARFAWKQGPSHPNPAIAEIWKAIHRNNPIVTDNNGELKWTNGCRQLAGTKFTGKTPQKLHISEYGPIAAQFPKAAGDIKRGSMNAVPTDGMIDIETTMEGGRMGHCYAVFKSALKSAGLTTLTALDWKMHYFSWLNHPSYRLPGCVPYNGPTMEYFRELTEKHGPHLQQKYGFINGVVPQDRQAWWEKKKDDQGEYMWQQFPTIIEECDRANVVGQIYPEMVTCRAEGRVTTFNKEPGLPLFVTCDLGASANTALWLVQPAGKAHNFLECAFGEGAGAAWVADQLRAWEAKHGPVLQVLLPHDANITDKGSGVTYVQNLVKAGVDRRRIVVVQRTPTRWAAIDLVRKMLPNCWFHTNTDQELKDDEGTALPGGVARMEGYRRTSPTSSGTGGDQPLGDICSHAADAVSTYAEARHHSLVKTTQRTDNLSTDDDWPAKSSGGRRQRVKVRMGQQ